MGKFKCPKCKKEIFVSKFRTFYKNGKWVNIDLTTNKQICCLDCNSEMNYVVNKENFGISYSSFSGLSPLEKQKLLRKRSDDDAKKQKYVEQEREKVLNGY